MNNVHKVIGVLGDILVMNDHLWYRKTLVCLFSILFSTVPSTQGMLHNQLFLCIK